MAQLIPAVRRAVVDLPEPPLIGSDEGRTRLFEAVTHFVLSAAQERPVVLVLDDLQLGRPRLPALLRHLAGRIAQSAVVNASRTALLVIAAAVRYDDQHVRAREAVRR